jgi:hypothetical protein
VELKAGATVEARNMFMIQKFNFHVVAIALILNLKVTKLFINRIHCSSHLLSE